MKKSRKNKAHSFCPQCGDEEGLIRVRRRFFDRLVSRFVSVRRYKCYYCGWERLIRVTSRPKKKQSNQIITRAAEKKQNFK
jgi:hypothetical protein